MRRFPTLAVSAVVSVIVTLAVAGCGERDDAAPGPSTQPVATTEPPVATTRPAPVTINVTLPPTTTAAGAGEGENVFGGDDPEDQRMPDVVCMDLQEAQNEIQDHGVFFSRSEDATGEGRRQLLDRNWIVVAQEPEAGAPIGEFEAVLYVVKDDEDHGC